MHVKMAGMIILSGITLFMPKPGIRQVCGLKNDEWMGEKILRGISTDYGEKKHADESGPFYYMMPDATFKSKDENEMAEET